MKKASRTKGPETPATPPPASPATKALAAPEPVGGKDKDLALKLAEQQLLGCRARTEINQSAWPHCFTHTCSHVADHPAVKLLSVVYTAKCMAFLARSTRYVPHLQ